MKTDKYDFDIVSEELEFFKQRLKKIEDILELLSKQHRRVVKNLRKVMMHSGLVFEEDEK